MRTKWSFYSCAMIFFIGLSVGNTAAGTDYRVSFNMKITRISKPQPQEFLIKAFSEDFILTEALYPEPPLAGFSPLIAITASNKQISGELESEHRLESGYSGLPLIGLASQNYIIGIYDSGAVVDLVAGTSADTLGIVGPYLTGNVFQIGGVSGTVDALLSQPIGIFAAGLGAVEPNGVLDLNQVKGHSNVSVVVAPEISCDNGEAVSGVVGTPFLSFYTAVIRNDLPRIAQKNNQFFSSPDVQILSPSSPLIPAYPKKIAMEFGGISLATTASYYPDFEDFETPLFPTMLSMPLSIPWGGAFFATIYVAEGIPGPTNPLQAMRVLVDTGAQSSIMTPGMAAQLSLPLDPDFVVDICGVGGLSTNIPVYKIDYVKINALGGAMEFSNAPFVIVDIGSPDGQAIDGVLGMNFFWNRNIVFQPSLTGSGFLQVSDPVAYGNADFNFSGRVDLADFAIFSAAWMSQSDEAAYNPACDLFLDSSIDIKDLEAFLMRWLAQ